MLQCNYYSIIVHNSNIVQLVCYGHKSITWQHSLIQHPAARRAGPRSWRRPRRRAPTCLFCKFRRVHHHNNNNNNEINNNNNNNSSNSSNETIVCLWYTDLCVSWLECFCLLVPCFICSITRESTGDNLNSALPHPKRTSSSPPGAYFGVLSVTMFLVHVYIYIYIYIVVIM